MCRYFTSRAESANCNCARQFAGTASANLLTPAQRVNIFCQSRNGVPGAQSDSNSFHSGRQAAAANDRGVIVWGTAMRGNLLRAERPPLKGRLPSSANRSESASIRGKASPYFLEQIMNNRGAKIYLAFVALASLSLF